MWAREVCDAVQANTYGSRDPAAAGRDRRIREHMRVGQTVTVDDVPAVVAGLVPTIKEVDLVAAATDREPRKS